MENLIRLQHMSDFDQRHLISSTYLKKCSPDIFESFKTRERIERFVGEVHSNGGDARLGYSFTNIRHNRRSKSSALFGLTTLIYPISSGERVEYEMKHENEFRPYYHQLNSSSDPILILAVALNSPPVFLFFGENPWTSDKYKPVMDLVSLDPSEKSVGETWEMDKRFYDFIRGDLSDEEDEHEYSEGFI